MRILFVHNALRSFVRVDRDILASAHELDELDLSVPYRIALLPYRLARADLVFVWFAGLHALFPVVGGRLLRKPTVVVVGGYDTANMPEIGYGHMGHPWKRYAVRTICRLASALIANSHAAAEEVRRTVRVRTPIHMLYHGFDVPNGPVQVVQEAVAISVGNVSQESLRRKGHDVFVRAAALVPDTHFVLAGRCLDGVEDYLRTLAPPNVTLAGFLPQKDLEALMARASVYVQASAHEGFGCAVAEAMAAGCIPVVSRCGALPEVVGEVGVFVDPNDPASVAGGIRQALSLPAEAHQTASDRIAETFPLDRRRAALLSLLDTIAGK